MAVVQRSREVAETQVVGAKKHRLRKYSGAGHPYVEGLLLALADWRTERRLLIEERGEQ
jgi:hypothetical protein